MDILERKCEGHLYWITSLADPLKIPLAPLGSLKLRAYKMAWTTFK